MPTVVFHDSPLFAGREAARDLRHLMARQSGAGNPIGNLAGLIALTGSIAGFANAGVNLAEISGAPIGSLTLQINNQSLDRALVLVGYGTNNVGLNATSVGIVQRAPPPLGPGESDALLWFKPTSFVQGDAIELVFFFREVPITLTLAFMVRGDESRWDMQLSVGSSAAHDFRSNLRLKGATYEATDQGFSVYLATTQGGQTEMILTVLDHEVRSPAAP